MRGAKSICRGLGAAALLAAAACDGNGGTGADRLTPAEVGGVYQICTLTFTPTQPALPAANLLTSVVNTTPPAGRPAPSVALSSTQPAFELVYTSRGDNFLQQVRGEAEFGDNSVFLHLYQGSTATGVPAQLLLPPHLDLVFTPDPRRLTAGAEVSSYSVARADYARAAGITEEGLATRIQGRITASLAEGACP